jgi:hypothetical protein
VRIKSQGDSIFELMPADELQPERECSRTEVLNLIPELRLTMTIVEGNALIGGTVNINRRPADLETQLLVNASWTGIDCVPHSSSQAHYNLFTPEQSLPRSFLGGLDSDWRPVAIFNVSGEISTSFSYTSATFEDLAFSPLGPPFINLGLRENVVESYSYSTGGMTGGLPREGCADLQASFRQLNTGATFEEIESKFGCDGRSNMVTLSGAGEQRNYQWQ